MTDVSDGVEVVESKKPSSLVDLASNIDEAKMKAMRERLSKMSPEEMRAQMERMKKMKSALSSDQVEKLKQVAKAKMGTNVDVDGSLKEQVVKASEVVVGLGEDEDRKLMPVSLDSSNLTSVVPTGGSSAENTEALSLEQIYRKIEEMGFGEAREKFLKSMSKEKRSKLEMYMSQQNPGMLLMSEACKGNLAKAKDLVDIGANVNYREDRGDSVLMMACWFGHADLVSFLLEKKADIHLKNDTEQTALHYASMKGHIKIIKMLMSRGASFDEEDNKGYTSVMCAAQFGHTALLDFFKRRGANLFHRDMEEHTVLHWTAYNKHPMATTWILNEGVDINAKDSKGRTAIHWAAKQGNSSILQILVEFIDEEGFTMLLHEKDKEGKTPLDLARYYENHKATTYIKDVLRRQHGCMAVWDRLTCQSGIRPGAEMRSTARTVTGWLLIVMALSVCHAMFLVQPYSPTIPPACYPALVVLSLLCYALWFACHCVDPGFIDPKPGSTAYRKLHKKTKANRPRQRTAAGGYVATGNSVEAEETEMSLFDDDEEEADIEAGGEDAKTAMRVGGDVKGREQKQTDDWPEDTPAWALPYEVLLERGRFDAICVTCGIVKPLRSKHCKHTGRCVARFDHFCPWVDNVVAENNRRQFVLLAVVQTTTTWFYAVLVGIHLNHHSCSDALAFTIGLPMMIHACLVATWGLALAQEHINLAASNITTNEKMNQHRYSYMRREDGSPHNPFDKGVKANCLYFFGCRPQDDWRDLDINTKFIAPGRKGACCAAHAPHGHGGGGDQKKKCQKTTQSARGEGESGDELVVDGEVLVENKLDDPDLESAVIEQQGLLRDDEQGEEGGL